MTKQFFASVMVLALAAMVVGVGVNAGETVTATVTPQIVSVTVTNGSVDYGILSVSDTNNTFDGVAISDTQTITSGSNVSTDIVIRSSDAVGGAADWDLGAAVGTDVYVHSYDINAAGPAVWVAFPADNSNTGVVSTLPGNGDTAFLDLKIDTPSVITDTDVHSITVTVVAIAT